jgi:hypothetical protein
MIAHEARWDLLGSGAAPKTIEAGKLVLVDELDVADLESEAAHGYARLGASDQDCVVVEQEDVADGGRMRRTVERFTASLSEGRAAKLVLRVSADVPVDLVVRAGSIDVGVVSVAEGGWVEREIDIPGDRVRARTEIEIAPRQEGALFNAFHHWFYQ